MKKSNEEKWKKKLQTKKCEKKINKERKKITIENKQRKKSKNNDVDKF